MILYSKVDTCRKQTPTPCYFHHAPRRNAHPFKAFDKSSSDRRIFYFKSVKRLRKMDIRKWLNTVTVTATTRVDYAEASSSTSDINNNTAEPGPKHSETEELQPQPAVETLSTSAPVSQTHPPPPPSPMSRCCCCRTPSQR